MVQHNNEHLTLAQLSAYVDQELASDELALCIAHIQICQQCQAVLTDLRLTSTLLRGMPQVEVPRSFVLPFDIAMLPETPDHIEPRSRQPGDRNHSVLRRSLRALSTLAAVIGLVFILAGTLTTFPHGGAATATSSGASTHPVSQSAPNQSTALAGKGSPGTHTTPQAPTRTIAKAPVPVAGTSASSDAGNAGSLPPVLDLSQPEGRLGIGLALFVLGLLGVLLTRRFQREGAR